MTKKRKPQKTAEQREAERVAKRARDLAAVNIPAELAALPSGDDIDVNHAERDRIDGARRVDAFLALRDGMATGSYDAARRLEKDVATRYAERGGGPMLERVDAGDRPLGPLDLMVDAGKRVDAILSRVGGRDAWLLIELIRPSLDRGGWRKTVAYITGEENPVAQAAAVRSACANLAAAYGQWDKGERRAA